MSFPVQNLIVQKRTAKHKTGPLDAPVALYNPDGTPFTSSGGTQTTIPTGALVPGAGIDLVRDADSGVITASVKAKSVTADMLADGVIPAAYTWADLSGKPAAATAVPGLITGILRNTDRYTRLPELPALADDTHQIADRIRLLLDPPADTKMIGWCPACTTELRADEQEIAGGYIPCPACGNEYHVKDIHQLDMLRLRVSGVKGTPTQLERLLEPWGIRIDRKTIAKWGQRGIIHPTGADENAPVYLIWNVWQAHTRLAGYERARRNSMKPSSSGENATGRDRTR